MTWSLQELSKSLVLNNVEKAGKFRRLLEDLERIDETQGGDTIAGPVVYCGTWDSTYYSFCGVAIRRGSGQEVMLELDRPISPGLTRNEVNRSNAC